MTISVRAYKEFSSINDKLIVIQYISSWEYCDVTIGEYEILLYNNNPIQMSNYEIKFLICFNSLLNGLRSPNKIMINDLIMGNWLCWISWTSLARYKHHVGH